MESRLDKISQKGFSTLEVLLAMFILVMAFSSTVLVSFGNQSMISDGQTSTAALNVAQGMLESVQAESRKDFNLVNPQTATSTADSFIARVDVSQTDYFTKLVTAVVDYSEGNGRANTTKLSTIVTNYNNAVGGDTCSSILLPNADAWKTPLIIKSVTNSDLAVQAGFASDNFPVTDVDAYEGNLYVTVNNSSASTSTVPTFFDFNASDPANIVPIGSVDNNVAVKSGLNAVVVAQDLSSTNPPNLKPVYAYVASATTKQFQVIEVKNNGINDNPPVLAGLPLTLGSSGVGNSIAYKNGYVYLGLTAGTGPEFYIIDVHDPIHPALVTGGNYEVGNDINAIQIRDQYAYLATPNSNNLIVLDVGNPSSPKPIGSFAPPGGGNGKSLYLRGDNLYFGRTTSAGPEFYILNNGDPKNVTVASNKDIGASVDGVIVRAGLDAAAAPASHTLAFLLTKTQFQVWDSADLSPWTPAKNVSEFLNLPAGASDPIEPAFDCENNIFFAVSNNGGQGRISVIAP